MRVLNEKIAMVITKMVGTMWAAYVFAAIAFISLPAAIASHDPVVIVAWVSQAFLQLVLLAVIMVGQDVQARGVQQKIDETHEASLAEFELAKSAQKSHAEELAEIKKLLQTLQALDRDIDNIGDDVDDIVEIEIRKKPSSPKTGANKVSVSKATGKSSTSKKSPR